MYVCVERGGGYFYFFLRFQYLQEHGKLTIYKKIVAIIHSWPFQKVQMGHSSLELLLKGPLKCEMICSSSLFNLIRTACCGRRTPVVMNGRGTVRIIISLMFAVDLNFGCFLFLICLRTRKWE